MITRKTAAAGLRALAVFSVLGGACLLIRMLWVMFHSPGGGTVGGLLFAAIYLAAILFIGRILRARAAAVGELGDSAFAAIALVSILLRTAGEVYAALGIGIGAAGCVFIWFGGRNPLWLLQGLGAIFPYASGAPTFAGGVSFLLPLTASAFFAAIVTHFLAEWSLALANGLEERRARIRS